jgi:hypothetical protein
VGGAPAACDIQRVEFLNFTFPGDHKAFSKAARPIPRSPTRRKSSGIDPRVPEGLQRRQFDRQRGRMPQRL